MAIPITYRAIKGSPLTNAEVDTNFRVLAEAGDSAASSIADLTQDVATVKATADAAQVKLVAGANIAIDDSDPTAPVISASGGGGTGTVQTVAGIPPVEGDILAPTLISALGIDQKLNASQKGQPSGVASLDSSGLVPSAQLPSYVDDVLEFFTLAAMPRPGESGKIYIALNTNRQYRWPQDGSDYVELVASPGTTDAIVEGTVNKYWTNARTLASVLTGFTLPTVAAAQVTSADTVLQALAKLQWAITGWIAPSIANLSAPSQSGAAWTTSGTTNPIAGFPAGSQSYVIPSSAATEFTQLLFSRSNPVRAGVRRMTAGALSQFTELVTYPTGTTVMDAVNLPIMSGATSAAVGKAGLVPAPAIVGANSKFLADDGTWKEAAGGGGGMAVGTMFPWKYNRATIPGGSLPHDGQIITNGRTLYPDFWALIQPFCVTDAVWLAAPYTSRGMFSLGDGSTSFRMPDDNGKHSDGNTIAAMFLRGDGKNSAGTPGLHQRDQFQGHRMGPLAPTNSMLGLGAGSPAFGSAGTPATGQASTGDPVTDGVNGTPRIGSETRSANTTVIWCTVAAKTAVNPGTVDVTVLANTVVTQSNQISNLQGQTADLSFGFVSTALAMVPGGTVTLSHGLGAQPQRYSIEATCVTAEFGYSIGTVIALSETVIQFTSNNYGCTVELTPTQLIVNVGAAGYLIIRKDTKAFDRMTPANWTLKYKASKS